MTPISIDEKEYLQCNRALARLLVVVYENQPINTRGLLKLLKSTHHGQTVLKYAEKRGYIERKRAKPRSVGQPAIMHTITAEGKRLALIARRKR